MIGVSPAYYISRYGSSFTIDNIIEGMNWLGSNGFDSLQLEIFHYEQMDQWTDRNCMKLKDALDRKELKVSQFVAHFLMDCFDSEESIQSEKGLYELEILSALLNRYSLTDLITLPVPPFISDKIPCREIHHSFDEKLQKAVKLLAEKDLALALEPQPGSLAADLSFLKRHPHIGLNLDPGHLLCSGINPFALEMDVLARVMATHLCENDGSENLSLRPGVICRSGWARLLGNLQGAGYNGSYDLEIICESDCFEAEYIGGQFFLKNNCIQNNIYRYGV